MLQNKKIILASSSPRRKELLQQIGLRFRVVPSNAREKLNPRLKPRSQAEYLSKQKAEAVAEKHDDAIIIAADTFIVFEDEIIGKPKSDQEAKRILRKLSGKQHKVITGFTIIDKEKKRSVTKSIETKIFLKKLTSAEIISYVKKEHLADKAGAYAIQGIGSIFIEKIEGDYFNVVGLPLRSLTEEMKRFGVKVL